MNDYAWSEFWQGTSIDRTMLAKALPSLLDTSEELKAVAAKLGAPAIDIHLGQVHAYRAGTNPPSAGVARIMCDLGGGKHRLGRRAARVNAGPAQVFLLDQRDGPTAVGQFLRQRPPGLAGANHNGVIVRHGQRSFLSIKESPE